jgi:plastocyanin
VARSFTLAAAVFVLGACTSFGCDGEVELPRARPDSAATHPDVAAYDTSFDPIDAEGDTGPLDVPAPIDAGFDADLDAAHSHYAYCIERLAFEDHTAEAEVIVNFGGDYGELYIPRCIVIRAGTTVTFVGYFPDHTLLPTDWEPAAVIEVTTTGLRRSFTFTFPGYYGYFCKEHSTEPDAGSRMAGTIEVVP